MDSKEFTSKKLIWDRIVIDFLEISDRLYSIDEIQFIIKGITTDCNFGSCLGQLLIPELQDSNFQSKNL